MHADTTEKLTGILKSARPTDAGSFLREYADELTDPEKAFPTYMRGLLREKGLRQQDVFLRADISEGYGYKLISGEKRTRRRDILLRLCIAAGFNLEETNRALRLCQMPTLYPRFPRDAVLIIAVNSKLNDPAAVDELLKMHGFSALTPCGADE